MSHLNALNRTFTTTHVTIEKKENAALGTAFARGTTLSSAYAGGRDFTVGHRERALVNELGNESIVRDGVWSIIPGGPHIEDLRPDDIIFNV